MNDMDAARAIVVAWRARLIAPTTSEHVDAVLMELIAAALRAERGKVWEGLKVTNAQLEEALKELGPTATRVEARIKATVQYVIGCRQQAREAGDE